MIYWNKWIVLTFDGVQLGRRSKDPATQEMNEYTDLMTWLSAEAEEVLQIVDQPVTDRQQEYMVQYKLNIEYHQISVQLFTCIYSTLQNYIYILR